MPQGWTAEMSHFVRRNFLNEESLETVQELFIAEYADLGKKLEDMLEKKLLEKKVLDAWFMSLRPARA